MKLSENLPVAWDQSKNVFSKRLHFHRQVLKLAPSTITICSYYLVYFNEVHNIHVKHLVQQVV